MRRGEGALCPSVFWTHRGCLLYLGLTRGNSNYTLQETTHTPDTATRHHHDVWVLCIVPLQGHADVYTERAASQSCCYKKRILPEGRTNKGCAGTMRWGKSEATYTWAHSSQHIFSGTWPTCSFSSGSRDFCPVGGSSTHARSRSQRMLTGLPLPATL